MRTVPLGNSDRTAVVDDEDYELVMAHNWHAFRNHERGWYARTKIKGARVFLHNLLLGVKSVDHRDGDGLNNTRVNLRPATARQNSRNRRPLTGRTSVYKGVYLHRPGWYRALIGLNGRQKHLGCFRDETDAARAYDAAAKELYGEYARLNFPDPVPR